ncbi:MAG: hypothetical protein ABJD97_19825 [Betaproteobacteria bacterium]
MNPLVNRNSAALDVVHAPPTDRPMQSPPLAPDSAHTLGAEDADTRYQGELFLPGWLPIEREATAEQGPGGG